MIMSWSKYAARTSLNFERASYGMGQSTDADTRDNTELNRVGMITVSLVCKGGRLWLWFEVTDQ